MILVANCEARGEPFVVAAFLRCADFRYQLTWRHVSGDEEFGDIQATMFAPVLMLGDIGSKSEEKTVTTEAEVGCLG